MVPRHCCGRRNSTALAMRCTLAAGASPAEAIAAELKGVSENGRNGFKIDLVRRLVPAAIDEARSNGRGA